MGEPDPQGRDDPRPLLVTGATGTVGGAVLRALRGLRTTPAPGSGPVRSPPVRAASRRPPTDPAAAADTEWVRFDLDQRESWRPALEGVGALFLVRPPDVTDVRSRLFPLIDAARAAGVERVVFLSLLGAQKNPLLPHRSVERYLERNGPAWTFLRAGFFMQNLLEPHGRDIRELGEIVVPAGRGRTSFVDARDVGAVGARTLTEPGHDGRAYDLTGPAALTYHDAAATLSRELGRPVAYREPSIRRFARVMRGRGHPWPFVLVMAGIYTTARLGRAGRVTDTVPHLLGRPATDLEVFVRDHRSAWEPGPRPA